MSRFERARDYNVLFDRTTKEKTSRAIRTLQTNALQGLRKEKHKARSVESLQQRSLSFFFFFPEDKREMEKQKKKKEERKGKQKKKEEKKDKKTPQ
jgi:hypothetical protein